MKFNASGKHIYTDRLTKQQYLCLYDTIMGYVSDYLSAPLVESVVEPFFAERV